MPGKLSRTFVYVLCNAVILPLLGSSCALVDEYFKDKIEEEVQERERVAAPGGQPTEDETAPATQSEIVVNSVQPGRGLTTGEEEVEIVGLGFSEGVRIFFNNTEVEAGTVEIVSETKIKCQTPAHPIGRAHVFVAKSESEFGVLEDGFEFFEEVTLEEVDLFVANQSGTNSALSLDNGTVVIPSIGGTKLTLSGTGFIDGTKVQFGENGPAVETTVTSLSSLVVSAPALARGWYDLTVTNTNGSATLETILRVYEPVNVSSVFPFAGPTNGGTEVTVNGQGFIEESELTINETLDTENNTEESTLTGTTTDTANSAEGAVDIVVENEFGTDTLEDGFVFYDPNDESDRVIYVGPDTGLIDGGREVHIVGSGFSDESGDATVYFGDTEAECTVYDDHMISCTSPADSEGTVEVKVILNDGSQAPCQQVDGCNFRYIDLRLDILEPNEGAIAGGTYVQITGNGFGSDTKLYFADQEANPADIEIVSENLITLKTPNYGLAPSSTDWIDVRVETQGVGVTELGVFGYFDPFNSDFWTSGGPVDGAVNITVLDGGTGGRMTNAFVMLGSNNSTMFQGFTDERGQITLSGPDVAGAQSVHATKIGLNPDTSEQEVFASFSWLETNSRNLTMLCMPIPPMSSGSPPPGPEPAIIKGVVHRIKDQYNTGSDYVVLQTTYINFSTPNPDPGPNATIINHGEYQMFSRAGELVVIALAGQLDNSDPMNPIFIPHAMGFSDPLLIQYGETYEDVQITIDRPFSRDLEIVYDEPPMAHLLNSSSPWTPNRKSAFIWYDFGNYGLHPMANILEEPGANENPVVVTTKMPKELPGYLNGSFSIIGGVYVGYGEQITYPGSEVFLSGLTDVEEPAVLTPFLGTKTPLGSTSMLGSPMDFSFSVNNEVFPVANFHTLWEPAFMSETLRWLAVSPGHITDFSLPIYPSTVDEANLNSNLSYRWQTTGHWVPNASYQNLDFYRVFGSWNSRDIMTVRP